MCIVLSSVFSASTFAMPISEISAVPQPRWRLRFHPPLENQYRTYQLREHIPRIRMLVYTAIAMMLFYSYMDYVFLPAPVLYYSLAIRLLIGVPVMIMILVASYYLTQRWFYPLYAFSYLIIGLGIVAILTICRLNLVMLPYEGLFLLLMFGYFLMALPFQPTVLISCGVTGLYLWMEWFMGLQDNSLPYNAFFLVSANIVGVVGCFLLERLMRMNFLNLHQLQQANAEAEQNVKNKTRFVAAVSHDLRQPIHAMGLMIDRLQQQPQQANQLSKQLHDAHKQLNELLNSLLDISKLDAGLTQASMQSTSLQQLSRQLPHAENIALRLGEFWVNTDPILLSRVLTNLIVNAQRHSQANLIEVFSRELHGQIEIVVRDNGIGISPEKHAQLFLPFQASRLGLGLGLAIVKELCDLMHIPVDFRSAVGAGCEFRLLLPCAVANVENSHPTSNRIKVLLLEDHTETRVQLINLLRDWGYQVTAPQEFTLPEQPPACDMIIADYSLGATNTGLDWIQAARTQQTDLPALLMSAHIAAQEMDKTWQQGIDFLPKPAMPVNIRLWLEKHSKLLKNQG
jgi:two-component system, sensor histidine kinase